MKAEIINENIVSNFKPIHLNITIETLTELKAWVAQLSVPGNRVNDSALMPHQNIASESEINDATDKSYCLLIKALKDFERGRT
jgi:hypothetical protein